MYSLNIIVYANNIKELNNFLLSLINYKKKFKIKCSINKVFLKTRTNLYSVLTSPHVHKTAQEQFKLNQIKLYMSITNFLHIENYLLIFKFYNKYCTEIKFKFLFEINNMCYDKQKLLLLPNKFLLNNNHKNNTLNYLKLLELYGMNKKNSLNSSVW